MSERWAVAYVSSDIGGEWACYKNQGKEYFNSETEAKEFADQFRYKGKPFYWQPAIWCEQSHEITTTVWRAKE